MRTQLLEGKCPADRHAVVHDVQVRLLEVDNPPPGGVRKPRGADVPLWRDDPVEYTGAGGDLCHLERDDLSHLPEAFSQAGASDAAAYREQLFHQPGHRRPDVGYERFGFGVRQRVHGTSLGKSPAKSGKPRSRTEITAGAAGHSIPNAGSSQRAPRSASGA